MRRLIVAVVATALCLWAIAAYSVPESVLYESQMRTGLTVVDMEQASDSTTFALKASDEDTSATYDGSGLAKFEGGITGGMEICPLRVYVKPGTYTDATGDSLRIIIDVSPDGSNWLVASADTAGVACGSPAGEKGYRKAYSKLHNLPYPTKYFRIRAGHGAINTTKKGMTMYIAYRGYVSKV